MKSKRWILALVLLVLASMACSLGGAGADTGEVEEPPAGAETEAPESEQGEIASEEVVPEVDPDALSELDSYRTRISFQWIPDGGTPETWSMEQEYTREPLAQRWTMQAGEDASESIEWVQIGDTAWFCGGGSCAQSQQSAEEMAESFGEGMVFEPEDFTSGYDTRFIGKETVNGVSARHYALDLSAAEAAMLAQGEVSDVEADFWISDESSLPTFVVRFTMSWTETREEQEGSGSLTYDVSDVNAPITIEAPEGAAGMPDDVPSYPNATDLLVMEGMASFSTADDVATVADFYHTELAAQGWSNESDDEFSGMVSQAWSKEGRDLTLMISPEDEGGSSVMLTTE